MAASEPSPVSDESSSEGPHLRQLLNETITHDQPTAMSPRSALLAHTSLREHSVEEPINTIIEPPRMRKRTSASEGRRKRERDLANASPSQRELVRLLIDQEQEASTLRRQLSIANQRVESEARRAAELEQANRLATQRYHEINESKVVVQQEASKAIQNSRLYHLELENAQKEIERAQESLKRIEKERDEAEAAAARARTKTRKLRQQQMVAAAREEGRQLGFEAGFEHARQERLLTGSTRRPHSSASRRNPHSSSRDVVTRPYSPAENPSYQRSMRSHNSQEVNEEVLRRSTPLDDLDTSPEPLADLQIRNLPPIGPSMSSPAISTKRSRTSPLRPFHPPPESTYESEPHTPSLPPPSIPAKEASPQLADRSPSIQYYEIDIPPQDLLTREEIMREFNTKENPNDIIKQMPRDMWVTAEKHREIRGSPPVPYSGPNPPPLLPTLRPQPKGVRLAKPPLKVVRFPSLAKTRQQAASWYRSFSFRKKNKPVIDPADDVDTPVQNQETTTPASTTSNKGKDPEPNTASIQASDSDDQFGAPPQPPQSWYKKSAPSSIRTAGSKRRPISGVESSPGLSQFELLFTPHVGTYSVRSGKEGKKLKEKDNLSVINEERTSLGNTPTTDRFLPDEMRASSSRMVSSITSTIPHLNFTGAQPGYESIASNSTPNKRRHPLALVMHNPDEPSSPPGVAYSQAGPSNSKPHDYSLARMARKASQSSERMSNPSDDSIGIDIVPPAPDPVQPPPQTGRNHLSPYHVHRPTSRSSSRIIPAQSITSLLSSSGNNLELPPPSTELRSGSRTSSRPSDNRGLGPKFPSSPRSVTSRPQSAVKAAPYGNPMANKSVEDARSSRSRTPRVPTPMMMPPRGTQTSPKPESVRSSASKKPSALNLSTSQTNLVVEQQQPISASSLFSPVRHSTSRLSLREAGSFSNGFDDGTYLDPAFYPGDKPSSPFIQQSSMLRDGHRSQTSLNVPSRPVSRGTSSALSYV